MPATHRTNELRSIALHRLVVDRIRQDTSLLDRARERVDRWLQDGDPVHPVWASRWHDLLALPRDEILAALVADTPEMRDLRQDSPFSGVVSQDEWWGIVRTVTEDDECASRAAG